MAARNQVRLVFSLLRLIAVAADLVDAEVRVRAVGQADACRGAADLLHRDRVLEVAEARPAELLLDREAQEPEHAELRPELAREGVGAVDLLGERRDLSLCERRDRVADHLRRLAEVVAERGHPVRDHTTVIPTCVANSQATQSLANFQVLCQSLLSSTLAIF